MRVMVVYAHPVETSFNAAIYGVVKRDAAKARPRRRCLRSLRRELSGHHEPRGPAALSRDPGEPCPGRAVDRAAGGGGRAGDGLPDLGLRAARHPEGLLRKGLPTGRGLRPGRTARCAARCGISSGWAACRPMAARAWRAFLAGDPPRKLFTRMLRAYVGAGVPISFTGLLRHEPQRRGAPESLSRARARGVFGLVVARLSCSSGPRASRPLMIMRRAGRPRSCVREGALSSKVESLCHVKSRHMKPKVTARLARSGWGATLGEGTACRMTNLFRRGESGELATAWRSLDLEGGLTAGALVTRSVKRAPHVVEGGMFRRQSGVSGETCRA